MKSKTTVISVGSALGLFLFASPIPACAASRPPNIVIILADDLGYGDLGCYGHPTIRTPNLDQMAREGMRFTDFYVAACVCTPSRAALLTGRLPIRTGMAGSEKRRVISANSTGGLQPEEITIAKALKSKGYATACVGKWHLGHLPQYLPTAQGFDSYLGLRMSNDMEPASDIPKNASANLNPDPKWWNSALLRNDKIIEQPTDLTTLTKRYTEEALRFIQENKKKPFFLYFAHTYPHVPLFASQKFKNTSPRGLYGDVVEELDWSVGQVLDTLRREKLNTFVFFTSDNGPWLNKGLAGGSAVLTTATDNYFSCFSDGVVAQGNRLARGGAKILTKKSGAGYVLGIGRTTTTSDFVYDSTVHNVNEVLFLVAAYEFTGPGVTNALLWINPPISSFGSNAAPAATVSTSVGAINGLNNSGVNGFVIGCQSANEPTAIIDELRIVTNWSAVTGGDPAIVSIPANLTVPPGATASFSVAARGTPALVFAWVKDDTTILTNGGHISGATTTNLIVSNVSIGDVGTYAMYVTNGLGNFVKSASASLSLSDPAITGQPQNRTNSFGTTATFQVTALGTAPFSYLWHKTGAGDLSDGGNIFGSHSNILILTGVSAADAGTYTVTVSNSLGTADSSNAGLTVIDPIITTQPVSVTNVAGSNVTFSVVASGSGTFTYQWYKNGGMIFDGGNLSGTASDTLSIATISLSDDADYNVVVTGAGSTPSLQAHLTVETPVTITVQPTPRTVPAGSSTIMAVGATGFAPLHYQWQLEGTNVPGAISSAYNILNVQPSLTGNYRVIVSNVLNSATSSVASLAIANSLHFYSSNFAVLRVGNGAQELTANGNSLSLDQFTRNGTYVSTLAIPDAGTNAMITMGPTVVPSPSSVTGTSLSRSLDGRQLVVAAYNTAVGFGSALNASSSASVPRAIGWINANGQYTLAMASTDSTFSGTFFRSAVSDGTNNFWGCRPQPQHVLLRLRCFGRHDSKRLFQHALHGAIQWQHLLRLGCRRQ